MESSKFTFSHGRSHISCRQQTPGRKSKKKNTPTTPDEYLRLETYVEISIMSDMPSTMKRFIPHVCLGLYSFVNDLK